MIDWAVFDPVQREQSARVPIARPGTGTSLTRNALGEAVGASPGGQLFNHPFRPFLGAGSITFNLGTVQSLAGDSPIEPKIGGLPMSGKNGLVPTPLVLLANVAVKGRSWAVLEVHPDPATGELTKDSVVEIVHTGIATASHVLTVGRLPITMILWSGGQPARALPIVHFNLRYARVAPSASNPTGAPRHLFL